jgi:hypothetical protein
MDDSSSTITATTSGVERYKKGKTLGEGTYGVVYKALDSLVSLSVYVFDSLSLSLPPSSLKWWR